MKCCGHVSLPLAEDFEQQDTPGFCPAQRVTFDGNPWHSISKTCTSGSKSCLTVIAVPSGPDPTPKIAIDVASVLCGLQTLVISKAAGCILSPPGGPIYHTSSATPSQSGSLVSDVGPLASVTHSASLWVAPTCTAPHAGGRRPRKAHCSRSVAWRRKRSTRGTTTTDPEAGAGCKCRCWCEDGAAPGPGLQARTSVGTGRPGRTI